MSSPLPLGVSRHGDLTVFRLFSAHADAVELSLEPKAGGAARRVELARAEDGIFEARVRGVEVGDRYGYRVHGPWAPERGHRFAPAKLLLDPYARLIAGRVDPRGPIFGHAGHDARRADDRDSAPHVPRGVVTGDAAFDWGTDGRPKVPWRDTVLYELHLKGFTQLMPDVPADKRGTFAGLASPAAIAHLTRLGVTSVELLPIHESVDEPRVALRGQTNYWGYNTLSFFAPAQRLAAQPERAIDEFRSMVKALHAAGIEVILDVVFNHTCEGDDVGPTLSLRGIDNATYYELEPGDPSRYVNRAACGNTLAIEHPTVLRLVMDSLRYWMTEMHVDGFRFDLATVLGREHGRFDRGAAFFDVLHQDPVLRGAKLIAEPWDATPEGFTLGAYPPGFREWNAHFRDDVRRFWNGYERRLGPLGYRLTGSSDVFGGRGPTASVNFVTCHDGFTLRDLVSFEERHNERNGEGNQDGARENFSANFGVEGLEAERAVLAARERQARNFLATLLLTPGVPMLLMGDEMGRTQRGNNNAYCLDDATSWVAWVLDKSGDALLGFTRGLIALRRELLALRPETHFRGQSEESGRPDVRWLRPDGGPMQGNDWDRPDERAITMLVTEPTGSTLALLLNGGAWPLDITLPPPAPGTRPEVLVDTAYEAVPLGKTLAEGARVYHLEPRSLALVRLEETP